MIHPLSNPPSECRFPLIPLAKADAGASPESAAFLEDLIDPFVMESYFRGHMAERGLLFHDLVAPHLAAYAPEASAAQQRDFITHPWERMKDECRRMKRGSFADAFSSFGSLLRLTADSPDLLAIIEQEGRVKMRVSTDPKSEFIILR